MSTSYVYLVFYKKRFTGAPYSTQARATQAINSLIANINVSNPNSGIQTSDFGVVAFPNIPFIATSPVYVLHTSTVPFVTNSSDLATTVMNFFFPGAILSSNQYLVDGEDINIETLT